jgi:predicted transposase YdaD
MDHDRLFKELLTTFFAEFIDLFLPDVARELDRDGIQFLDKQIFSDIGRGDRHEVDLLAKVRLHGSDAYVLVHVENQSQWRAEFPERMFQYYALIRSKLAVPVYPIAVYSFDLPLSLAPRIYEQRILGLDVLHFAFEAIQLNALHWRQFVAKPNPVASALMVKMRIDPADRPRVKLQCLRMLATLKLDPARNRLITVFMNSYLRLTREEAGVYHSEMQQLAPEEKAFVLEIENEWTEWGREQGREQGRVEGRVALVARLLRRRFGDLPTDLWDRIGRMEDARVELFAEALLDFKSIEEARTWLDSNP